MIEQVASCPGSNRPGDSTAGLRRAELSERLEDDRVTAGVHRQPHELVGEVVLDLLTEPTFFPACLAVLTQQVVEPIGMCPALPSQCRQSVVDALCVGVHAKELVFGWMVEKRRWANLFVFVSLTSVEDDRRGLLFHPEVDR
jgi:hypothetical protein